MVGEREEKCKKLKAVFYFYLLVPMPSSVF